MRPLNALITLLLLATISPAQGGEKDWFVPLGRPPKAKPRRISGGEAVPPLPLPATPLRRTERKRDPSPPKLIGKVIWGESASFTYDTGATTKYADWNLCPADLQQLLYHAGTTLGTKYGYENVDLTTFHGDPHKMPLLFFSGSRALKLDREKMTQLRTYVLNGGMLVFDDVAGSPYFYTSCREMLETAFPEFKLRKIPGDHPLYHVLNDIDSAHYSRNVELDKPFLEGLYVGSRIGVLVSKFGLGCGWDNHEVPLLKQASYYDVNTARALGLNIIAYAIGYAEAGRQEARPELFGSIDEKRATDEFVFAQVKHNGSWNVHPGSATVLLRRLKQDTSLRINMKRVAVEPGKQDLSSYSFLYLSGLDDFTWDKKAISALRDFLGSAGTLVINNGLGMSTFDSAVRRELKKLLPEGKLKPVSAGHPLYGSIFNIQNVRYTSAVTRTEGNVNVPRIEGIVIDGDLRVIYSPVDMACGWMGCDYPASKAYDSFSALQLGENIVMYAMTH